VTYRSTRARRAFESQISDCLREVGPLYKVAVSKGTGARLLGAYFVLAYSQLEVYLRSVVEDAFVVLKHENPNVDKWPDLMLGYFLHKSSNVAAKYKKFASDEDERAVVHHLAQTARQLISWGKGAATPPIGGGAAFLEKRTYPSPKNVPVLFSRIGVPDIWAEVGRIAKFNGALVLQSLNDIRTEVAHDGTVPVAFGFPEFRQALQHMERLVRAFDRAISSHFCSCVVKRTQWNLLMT
jgi:hypothetical protein